MIKKIFLGFIYTFIIIILLINIFSILNLSFFGFRVYKVGSGSMEPYLNVNDLILIKASKNYNLNDVVTYKNNNEYITHRIIFLDDNECITKGDANNTSDKAIPKDKIIGKLVYRFKFFKFINYLFSQPISWIILLVFGFMLIFFLPCKENSEM